MQVDVNQISACASTYMAWINPRGVALQWLSLDKYAEGDFGQIPVEAAVSNTDMTRMPMTIALSAVIMLLSLLPCAR